MKSKRSYTPALSHMRERTDHIRTQVRLLFGHRCSSAPQAPAFPTLEPYRLLKPLNDGSKATVYLANDRLRNRTVALKVLRGGTAETIRRFRREAEYSSSFDHPNIVKVYERGRREGFCFIAMEYIFGKTIEERVPKAGLAMGAFLDYALQMAKALSAVHSAGMIHRDLKPANFIVDANGQVKLLDFGLAKLVPKARRPNRCHRGFQSPLTHNGTILGTPGFMSPEQVLGKPADQRSDVFAFGAVLFYMLTRRRPFAQSSSIDEMYAILHAAPPRLPPEVPAVLRRVVLRCLEKNPVRRYPTATALAADLTAVVQTTNVRRSAAKLRTGVDARE